MSSCCTIHDFLTNHYSVSRINPRKQRRSAGISEPLRRRYVLKPAVQDYPDIYSIAVTCFRPLNEEPAPSHGKLLGLKCFTEGTLKFEMMINQPRPAVTVCMHPSFPSLTLAGFITQQEHEHGLSWNLVIKCTTEANYPWVARISRPCRHLSRTVVLFIGELVRHRPGFMVQTLNPKHI